MPSVEFNWEGIDRQLESFKFAVAGAVRPAAQAGAQVFYDEVKTRASAIKNSGTLAASIYQWHNNLDQRTDTSTYYVSWRKGTRDRANLGTSLTLPGAGLPTAFHGQLIEYGWVQRYATYINKKGQWKTAVRAENKGKKAPWIESGKKGKNRRATQAEKDAYYVLRKGGPIQHAPRSFLRSSYDAKQAEAVQTAIRVFYDRLLSASV